MDRNALLTAARAEFLSGFKQASDQAIGLATVAVFRKADFSFSPTEQRTLLDAHRILQDRQPELRAHLQHAMEQLLNRSFQTTYSTFRPSFSKEYNSDTLSLVDASQFEGQLRVDEMTNRFRSVADQPLRDLNIRIALLFEQTTIKERENPFRPWLFTRCISSAVEALGVRADLAPIVSLQIGEHLEESIALIYNRVNGFLAEHGVAAQLQLTKVGRQTSVGPALAGGQAAAVGPGMPAPGEPGAAGGAPAYTGGPVFGPSRNPGLSQRGADLRMNDLMAHVRRLADADATVDAQLTDAAAPVSWSQHEAALAASVGAQPAGEAAAGSNSNSNVDSNAPSWMSVNGLAVTMRRFLAGESSLRIFGTTAPDGRIAPQMGSAVDRSVSYPLAQSLQSLMAQAAGPVAATDLAQPARNLILEQRATLVGAAGDVSEQMTIDVVAMLFEFILRDPQIPAEVRAQLGRLQFLVLKVALRESTLLTQQGHPARMLVNRIGAISAGLRQLDPSGARIGTEICRIVESLLAGDTDSSAPFLAMLDEFDSFIADEFRTSDDRMDQAVHVIEAAQSRALRLTYVSAQLDEAISGLSMDPKLREFLMASWVYVIERAERVTTPEASRFRQLVPELLWSIVPHADAADRRALLALLPSIVRTIREGLALIEWDAARQQPILDWLVDAHRSVLRATDQTSATPSLAMLQTHFAAFLDGAGGTNAALAAPAPGAAQEKQFLDEAIRDTGNAVLTLGDTSTEGDDAGTLVLNDAEIFESVEIARLRAGVTVRLKLGELASQARLTWIDAKKSTLVLAIEGQATPTLISMRMFCRMYAAGRLQFVETVPLFERAIDSIQKSAEAAESR